MFAKLCADAQIEGDRRFEEDSFFEGRLADKFGITFA